MNKLLKNMLVCVICVLNTPQISAANTFQVQIDRVVPVYIELKEGIIKIEDIQILSKDMIWFEVKKIKITEQEYKLLKKLLLSLERKI